jgi:hypothetical protein
MAALLIGESGFVALKRPAWNILQDQSRSPKDRKVRIQESHNIGLESVESVRD